MVHCQAMNHFRDFYVHISKNKKIALFAPSIFLPLFLLTHRVWWTVTRTMVIHDWSYNKTYIYFWSVVDILSSYVESNVIYNTIHKEQYTYTLCVFFFAVKQVHALFLTHYHWVYMKLPTKKNGIVILYQPRTFLHFNCVFKSICLRRKHPVFISANPLSTPEWNYIL